MKTTLIALFALVGLSLLNVGGADAAQFGWRRGRTMYYAPAPQVTVAPSSGYRTYSYEPSAGYQAYSYEPRGTTSRWNNRMPTGGFQDAGWKIRGMR
jgi:hypothetical protein